METKRIKLEDVAPGMLLELKVEVDVLEQVLMEEVVLEEVEVEEVELEESLRSAIMSSMPLLKSEVKLYANLKEERLKEKLVKLERELVEKDDKLKQIEKESSDELAKCRSLLHSANDQISQKDEELQMLKSLNSKISEDLGLVNKIGIHDKIQINAMEEKIVNLENQLAEKSTGQTDKSTGQIKALKEEVQYLNSAKKDKASKYRDQLNAMSEQIGKLKMEKVQLQENIDVAQDITSSLAQKTSACQSCSSTGSFLEPYDAIHSDTTRPIQRGISQSVCPVKDEFYAGV